MVRRLQLCQDMFLIGSPGPERRRLAFRFAEILKREVEYLPITRDTSESDLKQRRELRAGGVVYVDQAPVRAALHGRLLIIDGIERAERNVLPTINNLLENREMNLEDGRTMVSLAARACPGLKFIKFCAGQSSPLAVAHFTLLNR
jgi:MoxR-like ATPase